MSQTPFMKKKIAGSMHVMDLATTDMSELCYPSRYRSTCVVCGLHFVLAYFILVDRVPTEVYTLLRPYTSF